MGCVQTYILYKKQLIVVDGVMDFVNQINDYSAIIAILTKPRRAYQDQLVISKRVNGFHDI